MDYYVYILFSDSTGNYYKGQTKNLEDRIKRHNKSIEKSTKFGVPWQLIWYTKKKTRSEAVLLEKKLKNLSKEKTIKFIEKYS